MPAERVALMQAGVVDPLLQAFLAWRRSVLFLVAIALIPLTLLRLADASGDQVPEKLRFMVLAPAFAEGLLCVVCWVQLKNWTRWAKQRRVLFWTWVVFLVTPFAVFLIPIDTILADGIDPEALAAAGPEAASAFFAFKLAIALYALITLAPKAVSLLAGTIRASLVTKLLFAGSAGPGWLVVLAAPIYTLFVFTLLIAPYQLTGSGWYLGAMIALLAAQIALGRVGFRLARPCSHADAVVMVARARTTYIGAMIAFGVCLVIAMSALAERVGVGTLVSTVLAFESNVLILTLIGSDLLITNLDRAHSTTDGQQHLAETRAKLSAFVRAAAPPSTPPPPGPAPGPPPR